MKSIKHLNGLIEDCKHLSQVLNYQHSKGTRDAAKRITMLKEDIEYAIDLIEEDITDVADEAGKEINYNDFYNSKD